MVVNYVTIDNFENEVVRSEKMVLIDFYADWCGPCKMLSPVIEEISNENDNVKVCKVNVDEQTDLARKFDIMTIPTLIVMKGELVLSKTSGVMPKSEILKMLND